MTKIASVEVETVDPTPVRPAFTDEEAQVLVNLINIAIQVKGLEAAEAGVILAKRIMAATPK